MRSPCRPPADLEQCIAERRDELVKILLRKDEEVRRTSVVRSGSQVFGLAPDRFGSTCSFDPAEHPPSKVKMWTNLDKEVFFPEGDVGIAERGNR